jgi:Uma2 family endonuclease
MSLVTSQTHVEYPESDGKPMGETDLHRDWMVRILELLKHRYRGERVYVSSDLLVYYEEGVPREFVVPDVFVVMDCEPRRREVFKTWAEGRGPDVVWEVTSRSTQRNDEVFKPQTFAKMGVKEYFLYDPTSEYLRPPLRGFRLSEGGYREIEPERSAGPAVLLCRELGILHHLEAGELVMTDSRTGQRLLTGEEAEAAARQAEAAGRRAEAAARQAAEEEVRRLRALLEGKDTPR